MIYTLFDKRNNKIIDLFNKIKPERLINPKTNKPYTNTDHNQVAHHILSEIKAMNTVAFPKDSQGSNFWCEGARLLIKIEILALLKQCEPSWIQYRQNFNISNLGRMMTQLCGIENSSKPLVIYLERIALVPVYNPLWDKYLSRNMQASLRLLLHDFTFKGLHSLIGIVLCAIIPFMPFNFVHESKQLETEIKATFGNQADINNFYTNPKNSKID